MSRDIPIIFSAPMILAILREIEAPGTGKTMTRRIAEREPRVAIQVGSGPFEPVMVPSPWVDVTHMDRLWVRESLVKDRAGWLYAADHQPITIDANDSPRELQMLVWAHHKKRDTAPSIHMPRWASRLTLIVAATKIERLQDITEADAMAEGVDRAIAGSGMTGGVHYTITTFRTGFVYLWGSLHGTDSWLNNPSVVAISFKPHLCNIDAMPEAV